MFAIVNALEIQLQIVFYQGVRNELFNPIKHLSSGKKILLADNPDNHVLFNIVASQIFCNYCSMAYRVAGEANGRARTSVFPFQKGVENKLCVILHFLDLIFYCSVLR